MLPRSQLLDRMVFHAEIAGETVQLSFAALERHVADLVRPALAAACRMQGIELTEALAEQAVMYTHDSLAHQAVATVVRFEVGGGGSDGVLRLTYGQAVELYTHLLPRLLCPPGMQAVSDPSISESYAGYEGPRGSGLLVQQPWGHSSVSVLLSCNTQLLFREAFVSPDLRQSICMSKLPGRLFTALQQRDAAAAKEAEGEEEAEGQAADEAVEDGWAWNGARKLVPDEKRKLGIALATVSCGPASAAHICVGVPTLDELLQTGLAVKDKDGAITIPIRLGSRVSTQPGLMNIDHPAQKRADCLPDAASQKLRHPKQHGLARDTRAFNMRPLGAFGATYGAMPSSLAAARAAAAAAAEASEAAAAAAESTSAAPEAGLPAMEAEVDATTLTLTLTLTLTVTLTLAL